MAEPALTGPGDSHLDQEVEEEAPPRKTASGLNRLARRRLAAAAQRNEIGRCQAELLRLVPALTYVPNPEKLTTTTVLDATIAYLRTAQEQLASTQGAPHPSEGSEPASEVCDWDVLAAEQSPDLLLVVDHDSRIAWANQKMCSVLMVSAKELCGRALGSLVHGEDVARLQGARLAHPRGRMLVRLLAGTAHVWYAAHTAPVQNNGMLLSLRRMHPKVFLEGDDTWRDPGTVYSRHLLSGITTHITPNARNIFGYDTAEYIGSSPYSFCHHDDLQGLGSAHVQAVKEGREARVCFRWATRGDRPYTWVQAHLWVEGPMGSDCLRLVMATRLVAPFSLQLLEEVPPNPKGPQRLQVGQVTGCSIEEAARAVRDENWALAEALADRASAHTHTRAGDGRGHVHSWHQ